MCAGWNPRIARFFGRINCLGNCVPIEFCNQPPLAGQGGSMFMPHEFGRRVKLTRLLPRVLISREAFARMRLYVELADQEVGWLGSGEKVGRDFLGEEVFLFRREVSAATTEISPAGQAELVSELLAPRPDGAETVAR